MSGSLSNTAVLCFVMGYQGGTVHQVAEELATTTDDILNADEGRMGVLCRMAQALKRPDMMWISSATHRVFKKAIVGSVNVLESHNDLTKNEKDVLYQLKIAELILRRVHYEGEELCQ